MWSSSDVGSPVSIHLTFSEKVSDHGDLPFSLPRKLRWALGIIFTAGPLTRILTNSVFRDEYD